MALPHAHVGTPSACVMHPKAPQSMYVQPSPPVLVFLLSDMKAFHRWFWLCVHWDVLDREVHMGTCRNRNNHRYRYGIHTDFLVGTVDPAEWGVLQPFVFAAICHSSLTGLWQQKRRGCLHLQHTVHIMLYACRTQVQLDHDPWTA
jgi:hypothetical protein